MVAILNKAKEGKDGAKVQPLLLHHCSLDLNIIYLDYLVLYEGGASCLCKWVPVCSSEPRLVKTPMQPIQTFLQRLLIPT